MQAWQASYVKWIKSVTATPALLDLCASFFRWGLNDIANFFFLLPCIIVAKRLLLLCLQLKVVLVVQTLIFLSKLPMHLSYGQDNISQKRVLHQYRLVYVEKFIVSWNTTWQSFYQPVINMPDNQYYVQGFNSWSWNVHTTDLDKKSSIVMWPICKGEASAFLVKLFLIFAEKSKTTVFAQVQIKVFIWLHQIILELSSFFPRFNYSMSSSFMTLTSNLSCLKAFNLIV